MVKKHFGGIDIWISNAGIMIEKKIIDTPEDLWQQTMDVNVKSVYYGGLVAADKIRKRGGGVLINAVSFASLIPSVGSGAYAASKAAIANMTRTLAGELAPFNIRVVGFIPGVIETPMTAGWIGAKGKVLASQHALNRVGRADEIANALLFLASDYASFITGTCMEITGGKFCVQNPADAWAQVLQSMASDLELYHGLASTCSKKVRLCLYEKGLVFKSHLLNLQAFEQHSPEYLKLNPNGVVPTLVHNGEPIVESNVIIEYIDDEFPNMPLRPADSLRRAKMRCWIQFSGEVAYDAVALPTWMKISAPVAKKLSDEELQQVLARIPTKERRERWARVARDGILQEEIEECYSEMTRILTKVDQAIERGPWLAGATYSLADIAMIPFVDRIYNLRPDLCPPERYNGVADWYRRLKARPAFGPAFDFKDDPKVKGLPNI